MPKIYKIVNTVTDKTYIGKTTKTLDERFKKHIYSANTYSKTKLHSAIRKYGCDKFSIFLIEECSDDVVDDREKFWISEYDSFELGYNMTLGGDGGDTSNSDNFIIAMENYHKNKEKEEYATYGMAGHTHKEESKKLQSDKIKTLWDDPNSKYRTAKKLIGECNPMFGKTPKNAFPVTINGVNYKSIAEASRILKITKYNAKKLNEV